MPTLNPRTIFYFFLFSFSLGLSALLMFWLQPMAGKMLLPALGGSQAIWLVCLMFYQGLLLLGYIYTLLLDKYLSPKRQGLCHLVLCLIAFSLLPISFAIDTADFHNPTWWLLISLSTTIGLPFLLMAGTTPLLQRWFSYLPSHFSDHPYVLYAVSNVGSLAGLFLYPLYIEPNFTLQTQNHFWQVGFGLLTIIIAVSMFCMLRFIKQRPPESDAALKHEKPTLREQLYWGALAFIPCSLMMAVTTYITTDFGSTPLFWVIPLGLYLLTYILAFAVKPPLFLLNRCREFSLISIIFIGIFLTPNAEFLFSLQTKIYGLLACLFIIGYTCHGLLNKKAPHSTYLSLFYVWLSIGGLLGGIFNALIAPVLFTKALELPLTLVLATVLFAFTTFINRSHWHTAIKMVFALISISGLALFIMIITHNPLMVWFYNYGNYFSLSYAALALFIIGSFVAGKWFLRLSVPVFLLAVPVLINELSEKGYKKHAFRSFYGIYHINQDDTSTNLVSGTTVHGSQYRSKDMDHVPTTYYHFTGPMGQALTALRNKDTVQKSLVGVGLGAGAMACYKNQGQESIFFEIDPLVAELASNSKYFTYLDECAPQADIRIRDGRLGLNDMAAKSAGVIVLDAFQSDSIPTHLLTLEAFAMYKQKLTDDGIILIHISNRYYDLLRVLLPIAQKLNFAHLYNYHTPARKSAVAPSQWVVFAKDEAVLDPLKAQQFNCLSNQNLNCWQAIKTDKPTLWTDNYAPLTKVMMYYFGL